MSKPNLNEISTHLNQLQPKDLSSRFSKFAVVGIQLREHEGELQILYVQRAQRQSDPWSGQIGFPGGHAEAQDLDFLGTLKREYQEEMGCEWHSQFPIVVLDDVQARKAGQLLDFYIRPVCFFSEQDQFSYQAEEIADHFWVPLNRILDSNSHTNFVMQRGSMQMSLPAIQIVTAKQNENKSTPLLWGLSYMMTEILILKMNQAGLIDWPKHWRSYP